MWESEIRSAKKKRVHLLRTGAAAHGNSLGKIDGDEETKNIGADEVECSNDGPVGRFPLSTFLSPRLACLCCFSCTLSSSQDSMHCTPSITVCTCTPCQ